MIIGYELKNRIFLGSTFYAKITKCTILEAVIYSLQFSTTLLVLVIFFIMDTLHPELVKMGACQCHNGSVKIVCTISKEN